MNDRVCGKSLSFDCRIGLREYERMITQRVFIDFEAETNWRIAALSDSPEGIVDYYAVNEKLKALLASKQYSLIEAVAEDAAKLICEDFPVISVLIRVTKMPFDMPNVGSVSVECLRKPEDF